MSTYRIKDWSKHFENNRTKDMKTMRWVPVPNKHDGDGYTELLEHPNGAAHFGAWVACVQVASKCRERGTLLRGTCEAHDSASLARITRIPREVWDEALPRLVSIGWLETCDIPQEGAEEPQVPARKGMEGNGREEPPHTPPPPQGGLTLRQKRRLGRRKEPADREPIGRAALSDMLTAAGVRGDEQLEVLDWSPMTSDELRACVRRHGTDGPAIVAKAAPWLQKKGYVPRKGR